MKHFLDYLKDEERVYVNCYVEDDKIVLKIPVFREEGRNQEHIRVEKFTLCNRAYLTDL